MPEREELLDSLQGLLVLAAFVVLCLPAPLDVLQLSPDMVAPGAGLLALLALPALAVAIARTWLGAGFGIPLGYPLLLLPAGFAAARVGDLPDTFSASRSLIAWLGAIAFTAIGGSLGPRGRRVLQRGLPIAAIVLFASTLASGQFQPSGSLGNTGDLSEAAIGCVILGAGAFLNTRGPLAFVGFASLALYSVYIGLVPVYAGILGLGTAAAVALATSALGRTGGEAGRRSAARRARLLLVAVLIAVITTGIAGFAKGSKGSGASSTSISDTEIQTGTESRSATLPIESGGFKFRWLTWQQIPDVLGEAGRLGLGAGQFGAAYPPFRSQEEIELSSFSRQQSTPVDVEHAHNDVLTAFAEYGWLGGGAFALFLLLAFARGVSLAAGEEPTKRDFGLVVVALISVSLVNSPFLYSPIAPLVAFTAFGIVLSTTRVAGSRRVTDVIALAIPLVAIGLTSKSSIDFVRYGSSMAKVREARTDVAGREKLDYFALEELLDEALGVRSDSPMALDARVQLLEARQETLQTAKSQLLGGRVPPGEDAPKLLKALEQDEQATLAERRRTLSMLLARRPHNRAAHINLGVLEAKAGNHGVAANHLDAAYVLDPRNPTLLVDRLRLALESRAPQRARDALRDLDAVAPLPLESLRRDVRETLLGGRLDVAQVILDEYRKRISKEPIDVTSFNAIYKEAQAANERGDVEMFRAFTGASKMHLALQQIKESSGAQAVISARLARQEADRVGVDTSAIRLRLAAAHIAAGNDMEAQDILDAATIRRADIDRLDPLESKLLLDSKTLPGPSLAPTREADDSSLPR